MTQNKINIRKAWTREELMLVMHLYFRIPFGRQHSGAPEIIQLASVLRRTPGSVAMKLNNITSLDPEEAERGVKGLPGASKLDRQIWSEFRADWAKMAGESEQLWLARVLNRDERGISSAVVEQEVPLESNLAFAGQTERIATAKVRLAQRFFRRVVLSAYRTRCCISGCSVPELLIASHILPWNDSPEHRANPRNGLCLSRIHDGAFDQGLIAFDEERRLLISKRLKKYLPNESIQQNFAVYEGQPIQTPERFSPDPAFLALHRKNIFSKI